MAVIEPPVKVFIVEVIALNIDEKKLVEVAFAITPFVADKLVKNPLVDVELSVIEDDA